VKASVPVGVVAPKPTTSVTIAVQVVATFSRTVVGAQLTVVLVDRSVAVTAAVPRLTV
jgi:hypothetical protein